MTIARDAFASLSDDEVIVEVQQLAAAERCATASLIRSLMELDARRLYLREGCSSLFTYCTQVLHLAEGSAYNRIEVARAARAFPGVLDALETGAVTLTAVRLLSPHLTPTNHAAVLAAARHKSKREIDMLIAAMNPRPAVAATIRKLPAVRAASGAPPDAAPTVTSNAATNEDAATAPPRVPASTVAWRRTRQPSRGVRPQSRHSRQTATKFSSRFRLICGQTEPRAGPAQTLRSQWRPGHVFDRALTALLDDLQRRRCAVAARPREAAEARPGSRYIPAAVRRDVWRRDEGRCAFVGSNGRCVERGFIEFHHREPFAFGGPSTSENIELRCRGHNAYEAALAFGDFPDAMRETRNRWFA
jgi:hypothetical protein